MSLRKLYPIGWSAIAIGVTLVGFQNCTQDLPNYPTKAASSSGNFTLPTISPFPSPLPTAPSTPQPFPSTKTIFSFAGADQTYEVPSGVTQIRVKLWGAGGSSSYPGGGGGAYVTDVIPVVAGQSLTVIVGGGGIDGTASGAWAGGGLSAIKKGTTILAVAGAGGSGDNVTGVGGCTTGGNGTGPYPGLGGSQSAGGAPGGGSGSNATAGSLLQGGNGSSGSSATSPSDYGGGGIGYWQANILQSGGGGGGYYGGGGSGVRNVQDSGAGGGSSFWSNLGTCSAGSGSTSGNTSDTDYTAGIGVGGNHANGGNGLVVIY